MNLPGDVFLVGFEGKLVECYTLDDAIAVRKAGDILFDAKNCDRSPTSLQEMARVLLNYRLDDGAERIHRLASRLRAMGNLHASIPRQVVTMAGNG